jgi:hypothetical protein
LDHTVNRYDAEEFYSTFSTNTHPYEWESEAAVYSDEESSSFYPINDEEFGSKVSTVDDSCPSAISSALPGILLLCHQIHDEVTTMLYGDNTFEVILHGDGQLDLARRFKPVTREKMRNILLVLRPMGVSYHPGFRMDQEVWTSTLDGLLRLGIIAEQPEPPHPHSWPEIEPGRVVEEWKAWLILIFEFLARLVPATAEIVVDANGEGDTIRVIEKIIPERCQFRHLRAADFIFRRGTYSQESGYWDDDGPTSGRDIINDCDIDYYYSD